MIFLLLIISTAGSINPRIPVVMDDSGVGFIQALVPWIYNASVVDFRLDFSSTACRDNFPGPASDFYNAQQITFVWPNTTTVITGYLSNLSRFRSPRGPPGPNHLAIGSGSALIRRFRSVDYVKVLREGPVSGFLQLSNTYEEFTEVYCIADSAFNVTLSPLLLVARGYMGADNSQLLQIGFIHKESRFELPSDFVRDLETRISDHSSRVIREASETNLMVFESCGVVRRMLDPITVSFVGSSEAGAPHQGTIVFDPFDFTRIIDEDTCELLVQESLSSEHMNIDILKLKEVNMQFTQNQITFCDTSL